MARHPSPGGSAGADPRATARNELENTIRIPGGRVDRYGVVLVLIALTIIVDFSSLTAGWAVVLSTIIAAVTLVFVFTASDATPRTVAAVRVIAGACVVLAIIGATLGDASRVPGLVSANTALLTILAPVVIARRLVHQPSISIHTVAGGLCLYLLIGLFFAYVFALVNGLAGPFFVQAGATRMADFVYFSYITMATVGYGDLTPQTDLARMLAVSDGITGQLFLVTVVAFFLGNLGKRRSADATVTTSPD